MDSHICTFLRQNYGVNVSMLSRMTTGVGGDTFRVNTDAGSFVFKIVKDDSINHPEHEADICTFLLGCGMPVSEFLATADGKLTARWPDGRICHLQRLLPGHSFALNTAPDWFMAESPALLARLHNVLSDYQRLPDGIGRSFFTHMTPEKALHSYRSSLILARSRREEAVCEALSLRIRLAEKYATWRIDPSSLTCVNTHGDYTVNQILCDDGHITGIIDWTSACVHPVVWELTRSYFYAAPECVRGGHDAQRFSDWVNAYDRLRPLTSADRSALMDVYLYQLLVCDYYAQYLHAAPHEASEFLQQADFATLVLRHELT